MQSAPIPDAAVALGEVIVPPPPGLHWILVLFLTICTGGLFGELWLLVQANWVRKYDRSNRALLHLLAPFPIALVGGLCTAVTGIQAFDALAVIAIVVVSVVGIFAMKSSVEEYGSSQTGKPVYLSGPLTFFLTTVYLQYHMNRIRSIQRRAG